MPIAPGHFHTLNNQLKVPVGGNLQKQAAIMTLRPTYYKSHELYSSNSSNFDQQDQMIHHATSSNESVAE